MRPRLQPKFVGRRAAAGRTAPAAPASAAMTRYAEPLSADAVDGRPACGRRWRRPGRAAPRPRACSRPARTSWSSPRRCCPSLPGCRSRYLQREYRDGDLSAAWLAHAATDDPAVNARVAAEAERNRIWCVRADDADRIGGLDAGCHPARRGHGRGDCGGDPRPVGATSRCDRARARRGRRCPVRPRADQGAAAGSVALVGGGPGDPGLITVLRTAAAGRGRRRGGGQAGAPVAAGRAGSGRGGHRRGQAAARAQPDPGADQRAHRDQGAWPASASSG